MLPIILTHFSAKSAYKIYAVCNKISVHREKGVKTFYTTMPKEQVAPLIATTIFVSLVKSSAIAGVVLLIKWIVRKITNKNK